MKRIKTVLLAVMLVLLSVAFCGCKEQEQTIPLPDVQVGEEFEIVLETHGAYFWEEPIISKQGITYLGRRSVRPAPDVYGYATLYYKFKAEKEGNYRIRFVCRDAGKVVLIDDVYEITVLE